MEEEIDVALIVEQKNMPLAEGEPLVALTKPEHQFSCSKSVLTDETNELVDDFETFHRYLDDEISRRNKSIKRTNTNRELAVCTRGDFTCSRTVELPSNLERSKPKESTYESKEMRNIRIESKYFSSKSNVKDKENVASSGNVYSSKHPEEARKRKNKRFKTIGKAPRSKSESLKEVLLRLNAPIMRNELKIRFKCESVIGFKSPLAYLEDASAVLSGKEALIAKCKYQVIKIRQLLEAKFSLNSLVEEYGQAKGQTDLSRLCEVVNSDGKFGHDGNLCEFLNYVHGDVVFIDVLCVEDCFIGYNYGKLLLQSIIDKYRGNGSGVRFILLPFPLQYTDTKGIRVKKSTFSEDMRRVVSTYEQLSFKRICDSFLWGRL
mmetsp:Transcript_13067/g.15861  ORF Transcript_13067/g.15861 Transcript_13067/m.15861 type:complete len:377 (-) Transcript_13067:94-1224(-)